MTEGKCRITTLSREGMPSAEVVFAGDLWFFPSGLPHSRAQSESNTLLLTDWFAHTPPEALAKNFQVARDVFDDIPLHNLWIFRSDVPGGLEADQLAAGVEWGGTEPHRQ
jgi:oxalate decarboxylase